MNINKVAPEHSIISSSHVSKIVTLYNKMSVSKLDEASLASSKKKTDLSGMASNKKLPAQPPRSLDDMVIKLL